MNLFDKKAELDHELNKINEDIENLNYSSSQNIIYEQDLEYLTLLASEKIKKFYDSIINDFNQNKNYLIRIQYMLDNFDDSNIKYYIYTKTRYDRLDVKDHPKLTELYPSYKSTLDKKDYLEKIKNQTIQNIEKDKININVLIDDLNQYISLYSTISNSQTFQLEKLD